MSFAQGDAGRFDNFGRMSERPTPFDAARPVAASRYLVETAAVHGLSAEDCLAGSGISTSALGEPGTGVRADQELAIIRNVVAAFGDHPGLATEVGRRYTLADTGILGYALTSSRTFGDAIEVICRYFTLTATLFTLSAPEMTGAEAVIAFDHRGIPPDVRRFVFERDIAMMLRLLQPMLGKLESPVTVTHSLADLESPVELIRIDNLTLTVEHADRNALSFPIELLARSMPVADPQTAALSIRQCEELLNRRRTRRGLPAAVRTRILRGPGVIPSMSEIADELGMAQRTLRRKLAADGTTYRALLDEVRATLAAELLDSGMTVEATAQRLGYTETSAFTHAHVRWNGRPPSRRAR
ncbi:AraC-like DNA-binding protein [Mycobacterium sp. BK558]|nr:AraC-like DNA-binding protein [Mycobacterium sp. BK558]